jgi:hypothetical protein
MLSENAQFGATQDRGLFAPFWRIHHLGFEKGYFYLQYYRWWNRTAGSCRS